MSSQITPAQLRKINTIISKRNVNKETKEAMILGFTGGRSGSSKDLYIDEAIAMIRHLETTDQNHVQAQKMRGKILYYAHEMGWHVFKNGKWVADVKRVDEWCLKYGYIKRKLDAYTYKELPKLVTQFEAVYKHYINNL